LVLKNAFYLLDLSSTTRFLTFFDGESRGGKGEKGGKGGKGETGGNGLSQTPVE
jgi:hypothetical protein